MPLAVKLHCSFPALLEVTNKEFLLTISINFQAERRLKEKKFLEAEINRNVRQTVGRIGIWISTGLIDRDVFIFEIISPLKKKKIERTVGKTDSLTTREQFIFSYLTIILVQIIIGTNVSHSLLLFLDLKDLKMV